MKTIRKILSLCLSVLMLLGITVSGTMAFEYIQQNITTLANEQPDSIELKLIQHSDMQDPNFQLLPVREGLSDAQIVQSGQYARHIMSVENTGNVEVFVRIAVAIPVSLDSENEDGRKALHIINGASEKWSGGLYEENVYAKDVLCNVYVYTYSDPLKAQDTTLDSPVSGFYLDSAVTNSANGYFLGNTRLGISEDGKFKIPAAVQAVQSQGVQNAADAFSTMAAPTFQGQNI